LQEYSQYVVQESNRLTRLVDEILGFAIAGGTSGHFCFTSHSPPYCATLAAARVWTAFSLLFLLSCENTVVSDASPLGGRESTYRLEPFTVTVAVEVPAVVVMEAVPSSMSILEMSMMSGWSGELR